MGEEFFFMGGEIFFVGEEFFFMGEEFFFVGRKWIVSSKANVYQPTPYRQARPARLLYPVL